MRDYAQRLHGLGTTIFAEMSALAFRSGISTQDHLPTFPPQNNSKHQDPLAHN
jgi:hypothetical protein